jgi:hypothetical protein
MADDPDGAGVIEPEGKLRYVSATIRRSSGSRGVGNGLEGRTQSDAVAGLEEFRGAGDELAEGKPPETDRSAAGQRGQIGLASDHGGW